MTATVDVPTGNTYDKYASSNPIERRLMAGFMGSLDDLLPATPPATVLEVGLGEGDRDAAHDDVALPARRRAFRARRPPAPSRPGPSGLPAPAAPTGLP